jgi:hypothetical protein
MPGERHEIDRSTMPQILCPGAARRGSANQEGPRRPRRSPNGADPTERMEASPDSVAAFDRCVSACAFPPVLGRRWLVVLVLLWDGCGVHAWVLWVLVAAAGLHVVEEHALGWQGWAEATLGPRFGAHPTWSDFWATNTAMLLFAVSAAVVGWRAAAFALGLPALELINAVLFHIVPSLQARRPNPGVFTAVLLYIPVSIWVYVAASTDGLLSPGTLIVSLAIGATAMTSAIVFLALKPRLAYKDASPAAPRTQ